MAFQAGDPLTAAQINNITTKYLEARSSADEVPDTTLTDVNGATVTFTTALANTVVRVESFWDLNIATGATYIGTLYVDGVVEATGECHANVSATARMSLAQGWTVTLASAGSHTLKLRRVMTANVTANLFGTHTKIQISGPGLT
jgi:hypothetical protein